MRKLLLLFVFLFACSEPVDPKAAFDQGKYKQAYAIWLPMAEQGDPAAQNYIGIQHYLGLGMKRNFKLAKQWFEKAAHQDYADAQYNLGMMYENGHYVKQDYVKAFTWFYIASEKGSANAEKRMQSINDEYRLPPFQIWNAVDLAKDYLKDHP